MQVTHLEIHIRNELIVQPVATTKESVLAALACIVVACSARLEALDLRLEWCCKDAVIQKVLVRHSSLSPCISCLAVIIKNSLTPGVVELDELLTHFVLILAARGCAVRAATVTAPSRGVHRMGTEQPCMGRGDLQRV